MRHLITILLSAFALTIMAQRECEVAGEYIYHAKEWQTPSLAKMLALQFAQADAIAKEFGTDVNTHTSLITANQAVKLTQFSDTDVRGVWLRDLSAPKFETLAWDEGFAIKCIVHGLAREVTSTSVDYKARVLCNGFEKNHERTDFKDGDKLYLSFTSPTDGYLAVYLIDTNQTAFCALPYYNQTNGIYEIKAGKEYRLFSEEEAVGTKDEAYAESYLLTAEHDYEVNMLYVIFSPNKFTKASDHEGTRQELPRNLTFEQFGKWLGKRYSADKELTVSKYLITIAK